MSLITYTRTKTTIKKITSERDQLDTLFRVWQFLSHTLLLIIGNDYHVPISNDMPCVCDFFFFFKKLY